MRARLDRDLAQGEAEVERLGAELAVVDERIARAASSGLRSASLLAFCARWVAIVDRPLDFATRRRTAEAFEVRVTVDRDQWRGSFYADLSDGAEVTTRPSTETGRNRDNRVWFARERPSGHHSPRAAAAPCR